MLTGFAKTVQSITEEALLIIRGQRLSVDEAIKVVLRRKGIDAEWGLYIRQVRPKIKKSLALDATRANEEKRRAQRRASRWELRAAHGHEGYHQARLGDDY